ncbi:AAA family ATPase [Phytohabitans kaempferiae]|uniref:AAA family ATPase n=1 Tax=Phytohabitans kaempferiae TaxID=1620943 RepID=A0ABV6LVY3_9ACTN
MSTRLRIDSIELGTSGGPVRYDFSGPLTVLSGPVGAGKSSLLELIKHGLGGRARFSPVVSEHVSAVTLGVAAGRERYEITRAVHDEVGHVQVRDLITQEDLGFFVTEGQKRADKETVGKLLLRALGLPTDARASSANKKATGRPSLITFNDVWSSLYVEQPEIDRSIAHHTDTYREPKRRTVFKLFFGLTDAELLSLSARLQTAEQELAAAEAEEGSISRFLRSADAGGRDEALIAQEQARLDLERSQERLRRLSNEADPADAQTDVLRDLMVATLERVDSLRRELTDVEVAHEGRLGLAAGIRQDLARLSRAQEAGRRLADFEFVVCPRCSQSIRDRDVAHGSCRLCLQPEPILDSGDEVSSYEVRQLEAQQSEVVELLAAGEGRMVELRTRLIETEEHAKRLASAVDERTRELISPRLQAFSDASTAVGKAEERLRSLEERLRLWDHFNDISLHTNRLRTIRNELKDRVADQEQRLAENRTLLRTMSADYARTLANLGVPGVRSGRIDDNTYLPYVDGVRFDRVSTGGIRTALVVAYWVTLLATALRESTTLMPALLVLDSPRKSIGAGEALAANLYRQLDILAETYRGRVQIIVADNGLPDQYSRRWQELTFGYDRPVISSIPHPGPAEVVTLDQMIQEAYDTV